MTLYIHLRDQFDEDVEEIRHRFIPADRIEIDDDGNILYLGFSNVSDPATASLQWQRIDRSGNKHDGYKFLYPVTDPNMKRTLEEYDYISIRDRLMEGYRVGLQFIPMELV